MKPGSGVRLYSGNVNVTARGPGGTLTVDTSDRGGVIDINNNGLANENVENRPTEIAPEMSPSIGMAKMVSKLSEETDGMFELQYTYLVQNLGDVRLDEVKVIEDLKSVFGDPGVSVVSLTVSENSSLTVNSAFNGKADTHVLDYADSYLTPGEQAVIVLDLKTTESFDLQEVESSTIIRAIDPQGNEVEDLSNDGVLVDPNGNGIASETDENNPTHVRFESQDALAFSSSLTNVSGDLLRYTATLKASIANQGQRELKDVQLALDLTSESQDQNIQVKNVSLSNTELLLNQGFDGKTGTHLFDPTQNALQKGTAVHVLIDVEISGDRISRPRDLFFELSATNANGELLSKQGGVLPIYVNTSTGEDAGLESDGDLASLLAERSYRRKRDMAPLQVSRSSYPLHMMGVDGVHGKGSLNVLENLELVPSKGRITQMPS